jgi:F-type H+-transporting ATPase subunit b
MLDISWILLGSTAVVFLFLILILNNMLYKPLIGYMEKRDMDIKSDLGRVGSNEDEIEALEAEAKKVIMDAKLEAAALREKAVADAKQLAQSKLDAKKAELAKEYAEFEAELSKERELLNSELIAQTPLFKELIKAKFANL